MSPLPLRCRILGALELAPMTTQQLARCLGVVSHTAHRALAELREAGDVRHAGNVRNHRHRSQRVFAIRASATVMETSP